MKVRELELENESLRDIRKLTENSPASFGRDHFNFEKKFADKLMSDYIPSYNSVDRKPPIQSKTANYHD